MGYEVKRGAGLKIPKLGEIWYLVPKSESMDTLTFTKEFSLKAAWKFKIMNEGYAVIEGGMISCGEWTISLFSAYKINGNEITFLNTDEVALFPPCFLDPFVIAEYTKSTMILINKK